MGEGRRCESNFHSLILTGPALGQRGTAEDYEEYHKLPSTFERYTDEAKRAVYFARLEAFHRDQSFITAPDLLVSLTWDSTSRACQIAKLKDLASEIRFLLRVPYLPSTSLPYLRKGDIPLDAEAKKVLAYAAQEADRSKQYWIDADHLLAGLLRFPNDAQDALARVGVRLDVVRSASQKDRERLGERDVSKWQRLRVIADRHKQAMRMLVILAVIFLVLLIVKLRGPV